MCEVSLPRQWFPEPQEVLMTAQPRYALPTIPEPLRGLLDLALDMRWCWSHSSDELWEHLAPELWDITHNPWHILQTMSQTRLEEEAADPQFRQLLDRHTNARRETLEAESWFERTYPEAAGKLEEKQSPGEALPSGSARSGAAADPSSIIGPLGGDAKLPAAPLGPIAYFSMEFGLSEALPIYSGGLGILAGDFLKSASDLGVPVVGVGLLWQQGYFRQALSPSGDQIEFFPFNDPGQLPIMPLRDAEGEWVTITLRFPRRSVLLRVWEVRAGRVGLYLLDANDLVNSPADRGITSELYGGGAETRLQQEMILGIGGWRLLNQLGIQPDVCHLNEGHAALAVLERARCHMQERGLDFDVALTATRAGNLFTTHTPVEAGFDRFPPALVAEYLGDYADELGIGLERLLALGLRDDAATEQFNMAYLAIRGSGAVNGVSRLHGEVSRALFQRLFPRWPRPEVPVGHVTNGVHVPSWDSKEADALWTKTCGKERWLGSLEGMGDLINKVSDEDLWAFRDANRRRLIAVAREHVRRQGPVAGSLESLGSDPSCLCDPAVLTLAFARRFATYKRANLLLHDPDRLERLLCGEGSKMQLVLAGKAHPADTAGKAMIRQWADFIGRCTVRPHIIFLVDYDMDLAEHLVHGADVWINTPRRPWEASGTSGMKVLVNGGLNLSELDGWWAEAYDPDVGWALGDGLEHDSDPAWDAAEAERLYELLENEIIPEFYDRDEQGIPRRWIARVRRSMASLTPQFSTNRMMRDYLERYYLPAAAAYRGRTTIPVRGAQGPSLAAEIEAWRTMLDIHWGEIAVTDYSVETGAGSGSHGDQHSVRAEVMLGEIPPGAVLVELYAEPLEGGVPELHVLMTDPASLKEGAHPPGSYGFRAVFPATRPAGDYTLRVVPWHRSARVPLEASHILWHR
jgi:glycogen phosphorylase